MNNFTLIILLNVSFLTASSQVMNVRKWRQGERDTLDNALALVDENYHARALPQFEHLLTNHPDETFLKYSYAKCALRRGDRQHEALDLLQDVFSKNRKVPDILFDMALAAYYRHQFDDAENFLTQYVSGKKVTEEGRANAEQLRKYIRYAGFYVASPGNSRVSVLGEAVNTGYDEHSPTISADGSMLVFSQAGPRSTGGLQLEDLGEEIRSMVYREDVMVSRLHQKRFQASVPLDSINTMLADRVVALSDDGRRVLVQIDVADGNGDIYASQFNGQYFIPSVRLKGQVNGYSGESHATLAPDGQTIFFSSDRPGGYGGLDIYRATLLGDSIWTNVQNLGDTVNTSADEDTPFMFADGRTLFFSSKGRGSMGGYDIFMTTMEADTSFSGTRSLGHPVNGTSDDLGFVLAADGRNGFMSSARKEGLGMSDIYHVDVELPSPVGAVYLARGKVTGPAGPVGAALLVERIEEGRRRYTRTVSDSATGEFMVALAPGQRYEVWFSHPTLMSASISIDARSLTGFTEQTHNVTMNAVTSGTGPIAATTPTTATTKRSATAVTTTSVASESLPDKDTFVPQTLLQKKTMRYLQKFGNVSAPGLEFYVQFAAVKGQANLYFPELSKHGRIGRLRLNDGYTRLTVGGKYTTMSKAFAMNKKAIRAGQKEAFVIALYNGKRVQYEELEKMGVFK